MGASHAGRIRTTGGLDLVAIADMDHERRAVTAEELRANSRLSSYEYPGPRRGTDLAPLRRPPLRHRRAGAGEEGRLHTPRSLIWPKNEEG